MLFFIPLFLIYFAFAFYGIGFQDLKMDEFLTLGVVQKSWEQLIFNRLKMGHPPLYFLATKAWIVPFGNHQCAPYILVIFIGSIGIPLIYLLARQLDMGKWSWVAALFWSIHPAVLYYARLIRPQVVVLVLCVAYLLLLLRMLEKPSWKQFAGLVFLGLIGGLTSHLLLFFWIGIIITSFLLPGVRKLSEKQYWASLVTNIGVQLTVSLIVKSYSGTLNDRLKWIKLPTSKKIFEVLINSLSGISAKLKEPNLHWVIPVIAIASFFWVLMVNSKRYKWNLLLVSSLISVFLFLGMSYTVQPLWVPRYLIIILPVMILVVVQVLLSIPSQTIATVCVVFLVLSSSVTTTRMIEKRNFGLRKMVLALESQFDPEQDAVLVLNTMTREALSRYALRDLDPLVARRKYSQDKTMKLIAQHIQGKSRLWVLEFPKKDSILRSKQWQLFEEKKFFEEQTNKLALHGYRI